MHNPGTALIRASFFGGEVVKSIAHMGASCASCIALELRKCLCRKSALSACSRLMLCPLRVRSWSSLRLSVWIPGFRSSSRPSQRWRRSSWSHFGPSPLSELSRTVRHAADQQRHPVKQKREIPSVVKGTRPPPHIPRPIRDRLPARRKNRS